MATFASKLCKRISNFIALHPMRMEFDDESGKLKSLTLSLWHPELWWYILVLICQLILWLMSVIKSWHELNGRLAEIGQDSFIIKLVTVVAYITNSGFLFLPRISMTFKIAHLRSALILTQEIDGKLPISGKKDYTSTYIIFSTVILVTLNFCKHIALVLFFNGEDFDHVMTQIFLFQFFFVIQFCGWLHFLHNSYYYMASRINQVTRFLQTNEESDEDAAEPNDEDANRTDDEIMLTKSNPLKKNFEKPSKLLEKLRTADALIHQLVRLSQILNSMFSFPVLFIVTMSFFIGTVELFFLTCNISIKPLLTGNMNIIHVTSILFDIGVTITILAAADLPVTELNNLRELVLKISAQSHGSDEKQEIMSFLMALKADRIQLSAGGFFKVGIKLVPSITESVATYLIILLQTITENPDGLSHINQDTSN